MLATLSIVLSSCSASKEKKVERFLSDIGGSYPSAPINLRIVEQPLDAIQGDYIEFVIEVATSDIPSVEHSFGFALNDRQVISKNSKVSPSYPWIISVSRRAIGPKIEVSIVARQPD